MRELAQQKGGKCLSNKYINVDTKLRWKCGEGHIWESIPYLIKSGSLVSLNVMLKSAQSAKADYSGHASTCRKQKREMSLKKIYEFTNSLTLGM